MARTSTIARAMALVLLSAGAQAADDTRVAQGKQAFTHRCAMCHREGGTGTFMLNRRLGADLSLLEKRRDLKPEYIRFVVRNGLVSMPRISRVELPNGDLDAVVAYLMTPATP